MFTLKTEAMEDIFVKAVFHTSVIRAITIYLKIIPQDCLSVFGSAAVFTVKTSDGRHLCKSHSSYVCYKSHNQAAPQDHLSVFGSAAVFTVKPEATEVILAKWCFAK